MAPCIPVSLKVVATRAEPYTLALLIRIHDRTQQVAVAHDVEITINQAVSFKYVQWPGSPTPVRVLSSIVHGTWTVMDMEIVSARTCCIGVGLWTAPLFGCI